MRNAQAVNCCAEVQALLGCPAVGPCRGVEGNCGDLPTIFADTPVPPYFPGGLKDYTCIQFPDDNNPRDSIIVALIALAVAIPVTLFLQSCFEIANDSEAPESWLFYGGVVKIVCGLQSHRRWHYTRGKQPPRFVRWYCRSVDAPKPETIENLYHAAVSWITGRKPPWTVEAEEAEEAEAAEAEVVKPLHKADPVSAAVDHDASEAVGHYGNGDACLGEEAEESEKAGSEKSGSEASFASAAELQASKRRLTAFGLAGVWLVWAIFAWFIFTYGMLIYKLLGEGAEQSFSSSFGVSYGVGAAAEWKDIGKEAAKAALILVILERLHLTNPVAWLEARAHKAQHCSPLPDPSRCVSIGAFGLPQRAGAAVRKRGDVAGAADAPVRRLPLSHLRQLKHACCSRCCTAIAPRRRGPMRVVDAHVRCTGHRHNAEHPSALPSHARRRLGACTCSNLRCGRLRPRCHTRRRAFARVLARCRLRQPSPPPVGRCGRTPRRAFASAALRPRARPPCRRLCRCGWCFRCAAAWSSAPL